ncbi:hypothetical protein [Chryseobacterium sp. MYb328]|uniref:hypothetical protein n=1 Tax=Chryseobacterium sp. MYb328 TaxID=2745231 RepID=UPI0030B2A420
MIDPLEDENLYKVEWSDIENADMDYECYINDIENFFREEFEEDQVLTPEKQNMKLISMTEFVLQHKENVEFHMNDTVVETGKLMQKVFKYAEFLRQPLTLGMFVPVDEQGKELSLVPLKVFEGKFKDYQAVLGNYVKAKEKVLFEEIKIKHRENYFILEDEDGTLIRVLKNKTSLKVEDLLKMSSVELTPSVLKQIGL